MGEARIDLGWTRLAPRTVVGVVERFGAVELAAVSVTAISLAIYVRTLLPGVSFGDWGEPALMLPRLGVLHPTGYPLYSLVGKLFTLLPVGSIAWRVNLLSAVAAAGAVGMTVLICGRLGVRPLLAVVAALALAVTGTLWQEATYAKMNSLHLFLMGLVIHRALVWRAERRDRDLRLGGLFSGLALANHGLAFTAVPIVLVFVLWDARRRFLERPVVLLQSVGLLLAGLSLYLFIPLRALAGPSDVYGNLLTWNGFSSLVSGALFRSDMHFGSESSLVHAVRDLPAIAGVFLAGSNPFFLLVALFGGAVLIVRDRWAGLLLLALLASNVYFFANYRGNLDHYLLLSWLVLAVWLAIAGEALFSRIGRLVRGRTLELEAAMLLLPIVLLAAQWPAHDQSQNHLGEEFTAGVFAALPPNAVLLTYWDALTPLSYAHCIEGERPDVTLRNPDPYARVTCDPNSEPLEEVARTRPVFAMFVIPDALRPLTASFELIPVQTIRLPYGERYPEWVRPLYRLVPRTLANLQGLPSGQATVLPPG